MRRALGGLVMAFALAGGACGKSEPNEGKLMPRLAPPPGADLPKDLAIAVEVDGVAQPVIDTARLGAVKPDFADEERKAWRLATLVGPVVEEPGVLVYATGAHDVTVELKAHGEDDLVGVIMVSRRGDVLATMVDGKLPFPTFHGQGGRLGRPPETLPRVPRVSKLKIVRPAH